MLHVGFFPLQSLDPLALSRRFRGIYALMSLSPRTLPVIIQFVERVQRVTGVGCSRRRRPPTGPLTTGVTQKSTLTSPLSGVVGGLLEIEAGMLRDERRESGADGLGKQLAENAELFGHPGRVLKGQVLDADLVFEQVDVLTELRDGVARRRLLERNAAYFVVDETGDGFDFQHVTVVHA